MNKAISIGIIMVIATTGCAQKSSTETREKVVGDGCEGCEAVLEYGEHVLNAVDTLPDFTSDGPKLKVTGVVYHKDGKTPAKDVILYIYHTNQDGVYPKKGNEKGGDRRHGYIRGWIKTGADGRYTFYTLKPAPYPGRDAPAHIHPVIKEPGVTPYWIDEYLFDDDPLLTEDIRREQKQRGGHGIMKTTQAGGMLVVKRDIVLGKNVPHY
jgi:protocatechuate 3,4-dioxygenase beta subunit